MENPVLLFFLAPFLMDILNKIKEVAGGRPNNNVLNLPKIPGMPGVPGLGFPKYKRVLIDFS